MRRSRNWRFSALTVHALLSIALIVGFASASRAHNFFHTAKVGGAEDEEGDYPSCDAEGEPNASDAEPVGVFTGKWFYRHVDLEVPGVFPIRLVRRYDSRTKYQSPLGYGWAFTYDMRLFEYPGDDADPDDDSIIIRNACGQRHRYIKNGSAYEPEEDLPGWRRTLAPDPSVTGGFILSDPRGTKWFFDDDGKMTQIRDPQGNSLRFEYSASKEPLWGTSPFSVNPD